MAYQEMGKFSSDRPVTFETAENKRKPWTFWDKVTFQGPDKQLVIEGGAIATLPKGRIGHVGKTGGQVGISAEVDITDLSVTFTAEAGRYYRIMLFLRFTQQTSTGVVTARITNGAGTSLTAGVYRLASTDSLGATLWMLANPGAGSVTYKARIGTSAGTVDVGASSTAPCWILVEDIGL